jgi:polyisoprenoid-binding protein YceI
MKPKQYVGLILVAVCAAMGPAQAADYSLEKGEHASVTFRFKHLGYSWLTGRFNKLDGQFSYDPADIGASKVEVTVDTASLDTNHAERDKRELCQHAY